MAETNKATSGIDRLLGDPSLLHGVALELAAEVIQARLALRRANVSLKSLGLPEEKPEKKSIHSTLEAVIIDPDPDN